MNAMLAICLLVTSCVTLAAATSITEPGVTSCSGDNRKCTVIVPEVTREGWQGGAIDLAHAPGEPDGDEIDEIIRLLPAGRKFFRDMVEQTGKGNINGHFVVSNQFAISGVVKGIGAVAGVISDILGMFLPNEEHEAIMREFARVKDAIQNVRDDIKDLERQIRWGNTRLQYSHCVRVITTAIDLASRIPGSTSPEERQRRQERFVEHCLSQGLQMSLDTLFDGVHGRGDFTNNILDSFYASSQGHRPNMIKLSARLMGLLSGGLAAKMAYEAIRRGIGGVDDIANDYDPRMKLTTTRVNEPVNRCTRNARGNMQTDLERCIRDKHRRPNRDHVNELFSRMSSKYDWFMHASLVYNDIGGFNNHIFNGQRVSKLHYPNSHKKCAINFYLDKRSDFRHRNQINEARNIVRRHDDGNAQTTFNRIRGDLARRRIGWWGLACIKRYVGLECTYNAGSRMIWELGRRQTKCLLLR